MVTVCYFKNYEKVKGLVQARFIEMDKFCGEKENCDKVVLEVENERISKFYQGYGIVVEVIGRNAEVCDSCQNAKDINDEAQSESVETVRRKPRTSKKS